MEAPDGYPATVYAPNGNTRVQVYVLPGDVVQWKRNGTVGSFKGRVLSVGATMRVEITSHDGRPIEPYRVNIRKGLLHAWRDGKDLAA